MNDKDKIDLALDRVLGDAETTEKECRTLKQSLDEKTKSLKALGGTPGKPVVLADLPINREMIEKTIEVLKPGRLKVKDFQRAMNFFDTQELSRVRKALIAAGVTGESAEGSVVFITLTGEFGLGKTEQSS